MKTKYFFRMLLMAVALVMGSQIKAAESEPIYQGIGDGQVNVGGNNVFTDASGIIRVYVESPAWTLQLKGSWTTPVVLQNGDNDGYIDNSDLNKAGGYIDAKLTASAVDVITQQGLIIWTNNKIVTKVTYILNGVESEPVFSGSGTGAVNIGGNEVFTNPLGIIRIYVESPSWTLKFAGSWSAPIVLQNGDSDGFINTNDYNAEGGYIDAKLTASAVDVIMQQGLVLWPSNIIVTKVTYVTGGTTPATPTHTLTISIDEQTQTKTVAEGTALTNVLPTPTKEGYTFTGWSGLPDNGQMGTSDLTVTAVFTVNSYALTFKIDGQEDQTSMVEYGTDITYPANPTKEGYTFTGWDNNPSTMPANDLTITALFKKTFVLRTGELIVWDGTPDIQHGYEENLFVNNTNDWVASTEEGGILRIYADIDNANDWKLWTGGGNWNHPTFVDVPSADITNTSTHTGYNATAGCFEFVFNENTKQNLQNAINDGRAMSISFRNITIYQVTYLSVPKHMLTISIDDQTTTMEVAEGTTLSDLLPANPTKTGYAFKGWSGIPDDGKMPTTDLTVTAQFVIMYKVEFASTTYGTMTTDKEFYETGETVTVTITANTGYQMESISTNPSNLGLQRVDDGVFSFTMPGADVTVTVRFAAKEYTLTFMLNDEEYVVNEIPQIYNVKYGTSITLPVDPVVEDGYTFSGWSGIPVDGKMPAEDLIVYGHFMATLSVGSTGYATYCPKKPIIFQGNEDIKAYIAKEKSSTEVTLIQVIGAVAAGTGLVLIGEADAEVEVEVTNEGTDYSETNLLIGVTDANVPINAANQYVLVQKTDGVKFADTAGNAAIVPVGKAYLQAPANSSRILTISFDNETTGLETVHTMVDRKADVYNLNGQRISNPRKGLYIVNGKKAFIK